MKYALSAALVALAVKNAAAHATFQELWVDGVDFGTQCARVVPSNSPIQDVTSTDMVCNAGTSAAALKCPVPAGSTVTVEMHQHEARDGSEEAIGGAHYGPVLVYMSPVADASTAVGADGTWFKVFQDTWSANGTSGSSDNWGTKDLNTCNGKMDVVIPADLAPGDYLLRAEAIALHAAGSSGGAQLYMTCYQITVSGSGTAVPEAVTFPGAYAASDPGLLIDIYQSLATYEAPGPTVYSGGSTKSAGAACANCEATCTAGAGATGTAGSGSAATSAVQTTLATSSAAAVTTAAAAAVTTNAAATTSSVAVVASSSKASSSSVATTLVTKASSVAAVASSSSKAVATASASATAKKTCSKKRRRNAARQL